MPLTPISCLLSQNPQRTRSELSVFSQDWWLAIARRSSDLRECKVVRGNRVVGRLAFVISRNRLRLAFGQDPWWSHLGGPILDDSLNRSEQVEVIHSLLQQLPRRSSFCFVCDPNLSYADLVRNAFRDAGFQHLTQTTYVRFPDEGDILNPRKSKHRGHIKRAAKSLECVDLSASQFVRFLELNLKARGKQSYAPLLTLTELIEEAIGRGRARAIAARPESWTDSGCDAETLRYDAAIVYLWDDCRCYYWLSTHRVAVESDKAPKPHPDAVKLLILKAIEHAQAMGLIFDADGVSTPGSDHLYRQVLGLKNQQHRDAFLRLNTLERLYGLARSKILRRDTYLLKPRA